MNGCAFVHGTHRLHRRLELAGATMFHLQKTVKGSYSFDLWKRVAGPVACMMFAGPVACMMFGRSEGLAGSVTYWYRGIGDTHPQHTVRQPQLRPSTAVMPGCGSPLDFSLQ